MRRARTVVLLLALAPALAGCGVVAWNHEPPYQRVANWGSPGPAPGQFNEPTGLATLGEEVFVADARNARIQVFDRGGRYLRSLGEGLLERPMNLDARGDTLYVADFFADAIFVFGRDGALRQRLDAGQSLKNPGGVAVLPDGDLLVADTYHHRVLRLGRDDRIRATWGGEGPGAGRGKFNYPTDVAAADDGGFYVADGYNDRVQHFAADGRFHCAWGGPFARNIHGPFKGWFATVSSVALGPDGRVFVADFYNDRVQKFRPHGGFLTSFGEPPGDATRAHSAQAIVVDDAGEVLLGNSAAQRVERWRRP